jgi:hypothetical protein
VWAFQAGNPIYASPAVVNDTVYVNSDSGKLYALKVSDGSVIWQTNFGSGSDHADDSPAVADGVVYVGSGNGYYAFNASDGSNRWYFTSPYSPRWRTGYVYSSPVVAGNIVYFGSSDSYVFALNASNGSLVWSYRTGDFVFGSPAIANGIVYVGSFDGKIYALGSTSATANKTTPPTPIITPEPTEPTATPSPTSTPTPADPTPTPTPQPAQTPTSTHQPDKVLSHLSTMEPTKQPTPQTAKQDLPINWIILGCIVATAAIALVGLPLIFKRED